MALDNVVPIDAEAARHLERRNSRFRWFVGGLAALWAAVLVPAVLFTPLPPLGPFLVLAALVVLAEHRFVLFGDETSMSASIIVIVSSIAVFADSAPIAGPVLVASLGGLYFPHLRHCRWALTLANAVIFGIAAAIAASLTTVTALSNSPTVTRMLVVSGVCTCTYWYSNSVLIGLASSLRHASALGNSVREQALSEWPVLILAAGSAVAAQDLGQDILDVLFVLAVLLAVFELQTRRTKRPTPYWSGTLFTALVVGTTFTFAADTGWATGAAISAIGFFIVFEHSNAGMGNVLHVCLALPLALGVAVGSLTLRLPSGLNFAALVFTTMSVLIVLGVRVRASRRWAALSTSMTLSLLLPSSRELAFVVAVAAAVVVSVGTLRGGPSSIVAYAVILLATRQVVTSRACKPQHGDTPLKVPRTSVPASQ